MYFKLKKSSNPNGIVQKVIKFVDNHIKRENILLNTANLKQTYQLLKRTEGLLKTSFEALQKYDQSNELIVKIQRIIETFVKKDNVLKVDEYLNFKRNFTKKKISLQEENAKQLLARFVMVLNNIAVAYFMSSKPIRAA